MTKPPVNANNICGKSEQAFEMNDTSVHNQAVCVRVLDDICPAKC